MMWYTTGSRLSTPMTTCYLDQVIKNYEYGLLDPTINASLVADQMRAGHRYYNQHVEIERDRRTAVSKILIGHPDTEDLAARVANLRAQRDAARLTIKAARKATRDRSETAQMRARVKDLASALKTARAELKAARDVIKTDPLIVSAIDAADDHAAARVRAARAACGAYWGTYLLQEQAVDAAKKAKAPPSFKRVSKLELAQKKIEEDLVEEEEEEIEENVIEEKIAVAPWMGEGRVSVQLQGGISVEELFGADTQIQIAPVSPDAHDPGKSRGVHRRASRTILRLRVQSTDKGKPVWAEWPMILHRPIPEGSRIKVATVSRRRRDCRRWDWRLLLTLEIPDGATARRRPVPVSGAVALNLGWCRRPGDEVRAGYVFSDNGAIDREIVVQPSTIDRVEKSEGIRSQRDKNLDAMRVAIVPWLREREADLPAWLVERTILSRISRHEDRSPTPQAETSQEPLDAARAETPRVRSWHVAQWRSASRFRALAFAWRAQRFANDTGGYQILEDWRYRDEHLERYESGMRRGGLLDRRERYRLLAADLAARYRTLVVDDFDLRKFQQSPAPEDTRVERPAAKRNQRHAAGSELRAALLNAFGPARVLKESSVDVTRACAAVVVDEVTGAEHTCGQIDDWDHAVAREHTCSGCGATWDQDQNACKNLIGRWRNHERNGADESTTAPPPRKESRSERLRRTRWKKTEGTAPSLGAEPTAASAAKPATQERAVAVPQPAVVAASAPVPLPPPAVTLLPPTPASAPGHMQPMRERSGADESTEAARGAKSAPRKESRSERLRETRLKREDGGALETP